MLAALTEAGSVSVFHADFGYLTVAHEGAEGPKDLALPLRRNPTDRYGGVKGTFRNMSTTAGHAHGAGGAVGAGLGDGGVGVAAGGAHVRRVAFTLGGQAREATLPAGRTWCCRAPRCR